MNLRELTAEWLKAHGYDGLCKDDCGCRVHDLMPCDEPSPFCVPGHERPATPEEKADGGFDYIIEAKDDDPDMPPDEEGSEA